MRAVVNLVLVAVFLIPLTTACAHETEHAYPADAVDRFVAACRGNAPERACECAIGRLQDTFSWEEFEAYDARMARGEMPPEVANAVSECAR